MAAAQEATSTNMVYIGALEVVFDEKIEIDGGALYYSGSIDDNTAQLVASEHNIDDDDFIDVWLSYAGERVVTEGHDTDNNGAPDTFVNLSPDGQLENVTGKLADELNVEAPGQFAPSVPKASDGLNTEDLVGDISDISIVKEDRSWIFFIILLIVGVALYFFWKRQRD